MNPPPRGGPVRTKRTEVPTLSDEFRGLHYTLDLSLAAADLCASDVDIWSMANPRLRVKFDRSFVGVTHVHAWLDVNGYTDVDLDRIFNSGVHASSGRPRTFIVGALQPKEAYPPMKGTNQYLYCKVAIGRAYPVKENEQDDIPVPQGFDSNYLCGSSTAFPEVDAIGAVMSTDASPSSRRRSSADGSNEETTIDNFHHQYVIANGAQVLPMYLMRFNAMPAKTSSGQRRCQGCSEEIATVHCPACPAVFCESCDFKEHNGANRFVKRHVRQPIVALSESQSVTDRIEAIKQRLGSTYHELSACPNHPSKMLTHYDSVLNVPVCLDCKMYGSHSHGKLGQHSLMSIEEAYAKVWPLRYSQCYWNCLACCFTAHDLTGNFL